MEEELLSNIGEKPLASRLGSRIHGSITMATSEGVSGCRVPPDWLLVKVFGEPPKVVQRPRVIVRKNRIGIE